VSSSARAAAALLLCTAGVLVWAWLQPDGDKSTEGVRAAGAPPAMLSALDPSPSAAPVQRARRQDVDVQSVTGDDVTHRGAAPLAPDGGALPDRQTLEALGAVVADPQDIALGGLPPPEARLRQARGAIIAFSDTVERLQEELNEAQQTGVTDTSSIERRLAAASRSLELARFAERATEAELADHPL